MDHHASSIVVSVIIPCYNEEEQIGACIKSILEQSILLSPYHTVEIIAVPNQCTDRMPAMNSSAIEVPETTP
jgi:glycosyltransferase involved in cell wall biosynthesis